MGRREGVVSPTWYDNLQWAPVVYRRSGDTRLNASLRRRSTISGLPLWPSLWVSGAEPCLSLSRSGDPRCLSLSSLSRWRQPDMWWGTRNREREREMAVAMATQHSPCTQKHRQGRKWKPVNTEERKDGQTTKLENLKTSQTSCMQWFH